MNRARAPFLIAMIVVLATSACLVTLPAPVTAPAAPAPVLAQTTEGLQPAISTVAFTATRPSPSETPANTMTPFPSITPLPTATGTATETPFGFFPSFTPTPTDSITATVEGPDTAEGYTDDWGSNTRCTLISKSPADWTVVPPRGKYKASWTLLNSGRRAWQANEMLLTYIGDAKLTPDKRTFLNSDVKVGETITPVINIYPPSEPGRYRTVWGLRLLKTGRVFCTFTIKITVK